MGRRGFATEPEAIPVERDLVLVLIQNRGDLADGVVGILDAGVVGQELLDDAAEGMDAFVAKRKPVWKGR